MKNKVYVLYVNRELEGLFTTRENCMLWVKYLKATGCPVHSISFDKLAIDGLSSYVKSEVEDGEVVLPETISFPEEEEETVIYYTPDEEDEELIPETWFED